MKIEQPSATSKVEDRHFFEIVKYFSLVATTGMLYI